MTTIVYSPAHDSLMELRDDGTWVPACDCCGEWTQRQESQ